MKDDVLGEEVSLSESNYLMDREQMEKNNQIIFVSCIIKNWLLEMDTVLIQL